MSANNFDRLDRIETKIKALFADQNRVNKLFEHLSPQQKIQLTKYFHSVREELRSIRASR